MSSERRAILNYMLENEKSYYYSEVLGVLFIPTGVYDDIMNIINLYDDEQRQIREVQLACSITTSNLARIIVQGVKNKDERIEVL